MSGGIRLVGLVVAAATFVACDAGIDDVAPVSPAPDTASDASPQAAEVIQAEPTDAEPSPAEGRGIVAGLDTTRRSVALSDIHFDTFDGGSILLSTISEARIRP